MRSFIMYVSPNIIGAIQVKGDERGWAYSTDGRYDKCIQYFYWKT
jgi:hypothetical protein